MNRKLGFAIVAFGALAITAPALAARNWPDTVTNYVLSMRKTVKTTDMASYRAAVKNPNGALLLDVREPEEFKAGHVPGRGQHSARAARVPHLQGTRIPEDGR